MLVLFTQRHFKYRVVSQISLDVGALGTQFYLVRVVGAEFNRGSSREGRYGVGHICW